MGGEVMKEHWIDCGEKKASFTSLGIKKSVQILYRNVRLA